MWASTAPSAGKRQASGENAYEAISAARSIAATSPAWRRVTA